MDCERVYRSHYRRCPEKHWAENSMSTSIAERPVANRGLQTYWATTTTTTTEAEPPDVPETSEKLWRRWVDIFRFFLVHHVAHKIHSLPSHFDSSFWLLEDDAFTTSSVDPRSTERAWRAFL